jgi:predicted nucleotidyltransferase component of viral defense system
MLHYNTINSATLELLRQLQAIPAFSKLRLVGGTSLALQIGHRTSIDLDLFGYLDADEFVVTNALNKIGDVTILKRSENINIYIINGIKVDIVNYPYSWLLDTLVEDNLKLARIEDIAAMKLAAITNRGTKKDFIDLFFLLKQYSLAELLKFYNKKYADGTIFLVIRSLSYFDDADTEAMPNMSTPINWQEVKEHISHLLSSYQKNSQQP